MDSQLCGNHRHDASRRFPQQRRRLILLRLGPFKISLERIRLNSTAYTVTDDLICNFIYWGDMALYR